MVFFSSGAFRGGSDLESPLSSFFFSLLLFPGLVFCLVGEEENPPQKIFFGGGNPLNSFAKKNPFKLLFKFPLFLTKLCLLLKKWGGGKTSVFFEFFFSIFSQKTKIFLLEKKNFEGVFFFIKGAHHRRLNFFSNRRSSLFLFKGKKSLFKKLKH